MSRNHRTSLLAGLRETLAIAKARGYLVYSVNANLVRDQFSIFQNLRIRGKELLEVKRIEYLNHSSRPLDRLENDDSLLAKFYLDLDIDSLLENHSEEFSVLLRARVVEAVLGELDYAVRGGPTAQSPNEDQSTTDNFFAGSQTLLSDAAGHNAGAPWGAQEQRHSQSWQQPGGFGSYSDTRLMLYLLSELVKTVLRLENGTLEDMKNSNQAEQIKKKAVANKNAVDLELYQYLHKGSVWQCFRRLHVIDRQKIRNTILRAVPKLNKLRQIAFTNFLHALCDVATLTLYRDETARRDVAEEAPTPSTSVVQATNHAPTSTTEKQQLDSKFFQSVVHQPPTVGGFRTGKDPVSRTEGGHQGPGDKRIRTPCEALDTNFLKIRKAITDPFYRTAHEHKELCSLVVNTFLATGAVDFACGNPKQVQDIRRSPFLSSQQKEGIVARLHVERGTAAEDGKDFGFSRFMQLEEWAPPPYRRQTKTQAPLPSGKCPQEFGTVVPNHVPTNKDASRSPSIRAMKGQVAFGRTTRNEFPTLQLQRVFSPQKRLGSCGRGGSCGTGTFDDAVLRFKNMASCG